MMKSLHGVLPSLDLNRARLGFLDLGQHKREDAVLQLGRDLVLVDPARKPEAARIVADVVLGIERLQPLVFGEIQPSVDLENSVFDADVDAALFDPASRSRRSTHRWSHRCRRWVRRRGPESSIPLCSRARASAGPAVPVWSP